MKQDLRDRWIAALRSGKYEQRQEALFLDNKYCCLGVLCKVADPAGWSMFGSFGGFVLGNDLNNSYIPKETALSIELEQEDHDILAHMNDDEDKTFPEIADWIEANIEVTP